MFIDFSKAEKLPEGLTPELLGNEGVQSFLKSQFESRIEVEVSGLKTTNAELKQKNTELQSSLDQYKDIDLEEVNRLKELAKNNGDATKQIERLQAERDALQQGFDAKLKAAQQEAQQYQQALDNEQLKNHVAGAISEYNQKFPTVAVKPGSERYIVEQAMKVFKRDDERGFVPMNGDRVATGSEGIQTPVEWVNNFRQDNPFFFNEPKGAGGAGGAGGQTNYNPTNMGGSREERLAALKAKHPELAA